MKLTEIENLTLAEIKARRVELVQAARSADAGELAERYVQARLDATLRDERLGEQGKTITALQDGVEALRNQKAALEGQLAAAAAEIEAAKKEIDFQVRRASELEAIVVRETARGDRLKAEALRDAGAVSGAAKLLNDAIAARQIERSDAPQS